MVPGAFMRLDVMPHNVNGKIDRKALPDPVLYATKDYVAPETEAERAIVDAMAKVLGVDADALGVTEDFFTLGGDSIKAIRLVSRLRQVGMDASVADVMRNPNARALATALAEKASDGQPESESEAADADVSVPDSGETEWRAGEFQSIAAEFTARGERIQRVYPLTPMQEGMLLEHVAHPESRAYRLVDIYECTRPLDECLLRHAVDALAQRHEVLRTAIIHKGVSRFCQAIVDRRLPLIVVDLTGSSDPFEEAQRIRRDILENGYDLQDKPLTQFVYARTPSGGYLIFATHHIIVDGWCYETLVRDLNALLRGEALTGNSDGQYERAVRELLARDRKAAVSYFQSCWKAMKAAP